MLTEESIQTLLQKSNESENEEVKSKIQKVIGCLIEKDFHSLVQLLYRIDVSEKKIKDALKNTSSTDFASVITDIILERHKEKMQIKEAFNRKGIIPEDEKW